MRSSIGRGSKGLLACVLALAVVGAPSVEAATPPSVRLMAPSSQVTLHRMGRWVPLDLGLLVASTGGDFELHVSRPNYESPVAITQVDSTTHEVLRTLPSDVRRGWRGLQNFLRITFRDAGGEVVAARRVDFCPNSFERQRVDDRGPENSRYPSFCGGSFFGGGFPFIKGTVWGIDDHWATGVTSEFDFFGGPIASVRVPAGKYEVTARITRIFRRALSIPRSDASVTMAATVKDGRRQMLSTSAAASEESTSQSPEEGIPTVTDPDPATRPDLVALPAWRIRVSHRRERDLLGFSSTLWNAGPTRLTVEGFRRSDEPVMDAYQYFRDPEGNVVGRAPVGTMKFDTRRGHHHWHFQQFARFTLLDASQQQVVRSRKQSFCLALTDAVDLTVPGADWVASFDDFLGGSVCGGSRSIWIREELSAGWGDTYTQSVAGQAFDITNLPNGRYLVRVEVNPGGHLYETTTANNVKIRRVRLMGKPGAGGCSWPPGTA